MKKILDTQRLIVREMDLNDVEFLKKMLCDKDVMYAYEHAFNDLEVKEWLERQLGRYEQYGIGLWAVILKQTNELIGQCGLTYQLAKDRTVLEIGYLFRKEFWRKGYATEAALACRDFAFEKLNAEEVCCLIRDVNLASQAVAKRCGMKVIGEFVKHYYGMDMPHLIFSVKKSKDD